MILGPDGNPFKAAQMDLLGSAFGKALKTHAPAIGDPIAGKNQWFTEYQGREIEFPQDILGQRHHRTGASSFWAFQRYFFDALFKYRLVAIRSARGSGKSHVGGFLIPTFFYTRPSKILTLAPTRAQNRDVTWDGIGKALAGATRTLPGTQTALSLRMGPGYFVKPVTAREPNNVRGYHAGTKLLGDPDSDNPTDEDLADLAEDDGTPLLIWMEEPQGIPADVLNVLRGMMNKPNVYVVMQGNPSLGVDDEHDYVRAFRADSGFHRIKVSLFSEKEMPDMPTDDVGVDKTFDHVPERLYSKDAKEKLRRDFAPTDPLFLCDGLGQFTPGATSAQAVPRSAIVSSNYEAIGNQRRLALGPRIGVDIGWGSDPCVAILLLNGEVRAVHEWRPEKDDQQATQNIAAKIRQLSSFWGQQLGEQHPEDWDGSPISGGRLSIDTTGSGRPVADVLAGDGWFVDRVTFSMSPGGHWRELHAGYFFLNVRAEMYWNARCGLQRGYFFIPDDDRFRKLWQELPWTHYEFVGEKRGTMIKLERKEDVATRHGHSPDYADAFVLACRETDPDVVPRTFGAPVASDGPSTRRAQKRRAPSLNGFDKRPRRRRA